jgi:predicted AAA+ superfamily ATPase
MTYLKRALNLPKNVKTSFFLWGPRKTGKTTILRETYPEAHKIDLLKSENFRRYSQRPELLRLEYKNHKKNFIIIDEVQKVPQLLDEVHHLIEEENVVFCLCGSSARKLRRGHANLLGGRALRYELSGFTKKELSNEFNLKRALNHGLIPSHYLATEPHKLIEAYVSDYLKEEIFAEGLTQNL